MSDDQKPPEDQSSKQDSDNINISDIGEDSILAVGRNAVVNVVKNTFVVDGNVQWIPVFVILLIVIGVLSLLLWGLRPEQQTEMTSLFNVAVAEFLVVDEEGKPYRSDDGHILANSLKEQLESNFNELDIEKIVSSWEIWGPEETGKVEGTTPEEREANARAKAQEINAHIVFYGVLTFSGETSTFTPEFYVNHAAFEEANELTGSHELGRSLRISLPLVSQIQTIENPALAGRANALSLITLGLAYYSRDNFNGAIEQFSLAEQEDRWLDRAGKEIVYLLLGNAYSRLLTQDEDPKYVSLAAENYETAITINENYGRAYIGLAGTKLAQAGDTPEGMEKLKETEELLDQALALESQPKTANIVPKTHFYRGQIAFLKAIYTNNIDDKSKWFEAANKEYRFVVDDYEQGNDLLRDFASRSYVRLGVIASLYGNLDQAVEYLQEKALDDASPFLRGEIYMLLGQVYCDAGQEDDAAKAYEEAIKEADNNGDENSIRRYEKELNSLSCGG